MKKQFLSYFSILFFTFSFAQDKVIEGHVFELVSEDSISPLPGVNVLFEGLQMEQQQIVKAILS